MRSSMVFPTILLLSTAFILGASPLTNGSFENNGGLACESGSGYVTLSAGSPCITGWSILGGNIDYISGYWTAADGTHSLDMNGNTGPGSAVQQTFDTIASAQYRVSFSLAGNPQGLPTVKTLTVDAAGQSANYLFDITGRNTALMGWALETFTFTANSSSADLRFTSTTGGCCWGPALDNVSVSFLGIPGSVPEPGSTGLMVSGVALLILGRRSLRRPLL